MTQLVETIYHAYGYEMYYQYTRKKITKSIII